MAQTPALTAYSSSPLARSLQCSPTGYLQIKPVVAGKSQSCSFHLRANLTLYSHIPAQPMAVSPSVTHGDRAAALAESL